MLFIRKKARAGENPEYPPRTHSETNIRELHTPSRSVSTQEQNEIFFQQAVQYSQDLEGEDLHYHVIGLNESSTENNMKKSYHKLDL